MASAPRNPQQAGQPLSGLFFATLWAGILTPPALALLLLFYLWRNVYTSDLKELVFRRLANPITLLGEERNPLLWLVLLVPVLLLGYTYIGLMYRRDGGAVGPV